MDPLFTKAQQELQERLAELPEEITDIITDGTLDAVVFDIQKKYALTQQQVTSLENEIIFVLAFFFETSEFVDNVQESLKVDRTVAEAIGVQVTTEIFELVEDIISYVENARRELEQGANPEEIPAVVTKKEELKNLAQTFGQPTAERLENPHVETLTGNVEPLRTMEGDMNRIHGYGTYTGGQSKEVQEVEDKIENTEIQNTSEPKEKLPT